VDDPHTWDQPWSAKTFWTKGDGQIYEYACQEGNIGLMGILAGARAEERAAAGSEGRKGSK